jgi:Lactonase, 7-bladed beta-propeller
VQWNPTKRVTEFSIMYKIMNIGSIGPNILGHLDSMTALARHLQEEGRLLTRPWITATKTSRLGLAQGGAVVRGWLSVFSMLAVGLVWLAAPLRAQFAYVPNVGSNNVSAYRIGANGALMPVAGSPFAAGSGPFAVAVDPTGKFAYVPNFGDDNVSAYSIGANGALTPVAGSPFAAGSGSHSVAVDPTGKFAYVVNFGKNNVSAYSIGANGALTPVAGSPFAAGNNPNSVAVNPTGKFAYVTEAFWEMLYARSQSGVLPKMYKAHDYP